ncbi:hypothetical protein HDU98_007712 [Podochytrium sp. JEL0797]|nr:hypothetical protein HDU98_007712 [Podochytrium sp. JEL0797]
MTEELSKKTAEVLKQELTALGLAADGTKDQLVARLAEHLAAASTEKPAATSAAPVASSQKPAPKELSEQEKAAKRAARFGMPVVVVASQNDAIKRRGDRFAASTEKETKEPAKPKPVPKVLALGVDAETLRKRAERFGIKPTVETPAPAALAVPAAIEKRAKSVDLTDDFEQRKKLRAERFGPKSAV